MSISFIGSGPVAKNLAALAKRSGLDVVISSRSAVSDENKVSFAQAAKSGDIVVVAIPFRACAAALPPLANSLAGKIIVDATNPLNEDYSPLDLGGQSGAEIIAAMLPQSRTVKAFNSIFADVMTADGQIRNGRAATAFVASDDVAARQEIMNLAKALGFAPASAGMLSSARYLEAMAHLNIRIAFAEGGGTDAAFVFDQSRTAA